MSLDICIAYITKNQYCFCAYSYEIIHLIKYGSIFDVISAPIFARINLLSSCFKNVSRIV